ncbi:MAG: helix-turn-helix domain-containing protein [Anaerotignaceae bacterium]
MYDNYIAIKIAKLRTKKGVSARDMSLSIGQNENYINHIENNKNMPSMQVFFYICEYLGITPTDFFNDETENPALIKAIINDLSSLEERQIENLHEIIKGLKTLNSK